MSQLPSPDMPSMADNTPPPDVAAQKRCRKGVKQPTREEYGERLSYTVRLLARKAFTWEVRKLLKARYGIKARTCNDYIARARATLRKLTGRPIQRHKEDAYNFWLSIIRDPEASLREKAEAQCEIQRLLGLYTAQKVELAGKDGGALEHVVVYLPRNGREASPAPSGAAVAEPTPSI